MSDQPKKTAEEFVLDCVDEFRIKLGPTDSVTSNMAWGELLIALGLMTRQAMQQARREGLREAYEDAESRCPTMCVIATPSEWDEGYHAGAKGSQEAIRARRDELLGESS